MKNMSKKNGVKSIVKAENHKEELVLWEHTKENRSWCTISIKGKYYNLYKPGGS